MRHALKLAAALLLAGACAAPDATTRAESPSEREYPTGSNIPRKNRDLKAEGVSVHTREDLERVQNTGRVMPERMPRQAP